MALAESLFVMAFWYVVVTVSLFTVWGLLRIARMLCGDFGQDDEDDEN